MPARSPALLTRGRLNPRPPRIPLPRPAPAPASSGASSAASGQHGPLRTEAGGTGRWRTRAVGAGRIWPRETLGMRAASARQRRILPAMRKGLALALCSRIHRAPGIRRPGTTAVRPLDGIQRSAPRVLELTSERLDTLPCVSSAPLISPALMGRVNALRSSSTYGGNYVRAVACSGSNE